MIYRILFAFALSGLCLPAVALELTFRPGSPEFADAALEYERIWAQDAVRIIAILQSESSVSLPETHIEVLVVEEQSNSGGPGRPMRLRASYPEPVKRGTLVHELAHRYLDQLPRRKSSLSTHQRLNLLLLPVWESLWGAEFVAGQVAVESRWSAEYRRSWEWAMSLSPEERVSEWAALSAR